MACRQAAPPARQPARPLVLCAHLHAWQFLFTPGCCAISVTQGSATAAGAA